MSTELVIGFTRDLPAEHEFFDTPTQAINFAKRIARDGYVTKDKFYPSHLIGAITYRPSKAESDPPAPGHGHY